MPAYGRVTTAILVLLLALGGGCASVRTAAAPTVTAPAAVQAHIVQAAWPGAAVRVVMGSTLKLDAFEGLLVHAGLETLEQLPTRDRPLDRDGATRLLALLRPISASGPPAIDVTIEGLGIREIKFLR